MIKIEHIKYKELIKFLNDLDGDDLDWYDELYSCKFIYESQHWNDNLYTITFAIDNGYYITDNSISIPRDFSKFDELLLDIQEPFDSGGITYELSEAIKLFVTQFENNLRDDKLLNLLESEIKQKERIRNIISTKISELIENVKDNDLELDTLYSIDDELEKILTIWNY